MKEDRSTDILIEALEVFIHQILYVREVYPAKIFRKRKIYNCPVFVSIYPPVNDYITEVLTAARQLKSSKQLQKVEIVLYRDERCIYEKYSFDIDEESLLAAARIGEDEYLLEFEQQLRTSLYSFPERVKSLKKLPKDSRFKLQLHTSQSGFAETCCSPKYQDFPWLQVSTGRLNDYSKEINILPLTVIALTGIKINVEVT